MIRTFSEALDDQAPLPGRWPDDPAGGPAPGPWWAGLDATHNRFRVDCPGSEHRAALLLDPAGHLVYRWHLIPTYGGAHITCPRSLRPICEGPELSRPRPDQIRCPHELEGDQ